MTDLKAAVFTVLEGWALPLDARKILETAYYAQPEREWVGLTDDDHKDFANRTKLLPILAKTLAEFIESKLKEKNT
jgi:hypothetical protein